MKKQIMIMLITINAIIYILMGCTVTEDESPALETSPAHVSAAEIIISPKVSRAAAETGADQGTTIYAQADWIYYSTLKELIDSCDYVIIGKVEKALPAIRINESPSLDFEVWHNYTPSQVVVEKVIKGDLKEGETVGIVQNGGRYTGITENDKTETITVVYNDIVYLEEGAEYLLFVCGQENIGKDMPYFFYLPNPGQGYCKIEDGKVYVQMHNLLFADNENVKHAVKRIEECLKGN